MDDYEFLVAWLCIPPGSDTSHEASLPQRHGGPHEVLCVEGQDQPPHHPVPASHAQAPQDSS